MDHAQQDRLMSLLAIAATVSPMGEVLAHLGALNTALVIGSPASEGVFSEQERAQAQADAFIRWTFLARAMVRLEDEWPLAAENGRESAQRLLELWKMGEASE